MSHREDVEVLKGLMRELLELEASRRDGEETDEELLDMLAQVAQVAQVAEAEAAKRDDPELRELLEQVIKLTEKQ